jgi:hypothetical protein
MINLEIPHINVLSKMDLFKTGRTAAGTIAQIGPKELERYLDPDPDLLLGEVNEKTNPKFHSLNQAISHLVCRFILLKLLTEADFRLGVGLRYKTSTWSLSYH